ncbi:MAG: hypothetical protein AUI11_12335 [Acidobacteria bacterium 13_2_20CM_2_66_4]|nr:MAG: hypothetical protein AUI11_12335 [Acidobacteria bacterium 13_2_20CM_2_66_4]
MPQLVDDLARRDAALSRRAHGEHVTARPVREVGQRSGQRGPFDRHRRRVGRRIVDRRYDAENVYGDIDLAGDRRYLFGSQAARVVVPVRQHDDRAPASLALGDSPGGLRDRIVQ